MPTTDFKTAREEFREYYSSSFQVLRAAEDSFRTLITALTADHPDFPTPTVESRTKSCEECIQKFDRKYRTKLEQSGSAYDIRDHISDTIGIRVICLYEADIPRVRALLEQNFECLEVTDKSSMLESVEDRFGYKGLHLDLRLNAARQEFAEYRSIRSFRFEVQLRTIVQDAWSVLDHKIKYKKSIPTDLKRRINILAALFELADREFMNIRQATEELEASAALSAPELPLNDDRPPRLLDAFTFVSVLRDRYPDYNFLGYKVDGFVQELLKAKPNLSHSEFATAFAEHFDLVEKYADFRMTNGGNHLNPFTVVRHILLYSDPMAFSDTLFESQKRSFEDWLSLMGKR